MKVSTKVSKQITITIDAPTGPNIDELAAKVKREVEMMLSWTRWEKCGKCGKSGWGSCDTCPPMSPRFSPASPAYVPASPPDSPPPLSLDLE